MTTAPPDALGKSSWLAPLIAAALPVLLVAPFANKAYHIDDPLTIWTAQQILRDPVRFFDYPLNWTGVEGPAYLIIKNPPLSMYYAAAIGAIFGWGEAVMHFAFLLPAALASMGIYMLARRFCSQPLLASAAAILTPAVFVSSSTVMSTVTMLACYVWAVECWLRGMDRAGSRYYITSGILISASALSQYFGASAVPLLLAYTLMKKPRPGWWLASLLIPVVILAAYEFVTRRIFGVGLFLEAGNYASAHRASASTDEWLRLLIGLVFTGGCVWCAFWFVPLYGRRALALTALLLAAGVPTGWWLAPELMTDEMRNGGQIAQSATAAHFAFFAAAGVLVLAMALYDLWRTRSAESALLLLWIFGAFTFASVLNWTVNARSLLGMAPPAAILAVRQLDRRPVQLARPWLAWVPIAPMAVFVWTLSYADFTLAIAGRNAADHFLDRVPATAGSKIFFGHWGFQYYMQQGGAKHFDLMGTRVEPGDMLILADNNMRPFAVPKIYSHRHPIGFEVFPWVSTWNVHLGAAYYSSTWGPFPYVIGIKPVERYEGVLIDQSDFLKDPRLENLTVESILKKP